MPWLLLLLGVILQANKLQTFLNLWGRTMKIYKVELIVKIQEDSYPDKWLADAVFELLEPENGEDIIKYRVTEIKGQK